MKVIFLDFDGVLNSVQYDRSRRDDQGNIDETRLALLKELLERTQAEIVLTTSWRTHWEKEKSRCDSIGDEINAVFERWGLAIFDKTPEINGADRALEISTWLQTCSQQVTGFVILDDFAFGWGALAPHVVKTNDRIGRGLERVHIEKALALLI